MIGSVSAVAASSSGCHIFSGCGFPSPSLESFDFKPIFSIGSFHFTKPILIVLIIVVVIVAFFWAAFYKPKLVPRGIQNVAEVALVASGTRSPARRWASGPTHSCPSWPRCSSSSTSAT